MTSFVHLHTHTENSALDGISRQRDVMERMIELGMTAGAVTEHGDQGGTLEWARLGRELGFKAIAGQEMYMAIGSRKEKNIEPSTTDFEGSKERRYHHLTVLVASAQGWGNLMRLSNDAARHFYHKPRIDMESLAQYSDGLIIGTGCLGGPVASRLVAGDIEGAYANTQALLDAVKGDKDRLFVEVMSHGIPDELKVVPELIKIAEHFGLRLAVTNDAHYTHESDARPHDLVLAIQTKSQLSDPKRFRFQGDFGAYHITSYDEMVEACNRAGIPFEAITNTQVIADMCPDDLLSILPQAPPEGQFRLPRVAVPEAIIADFEPGKAGCANPAQYWLYLKARQGMVMRFGKNPPEEVKKQARYELEILFSFAVENYFHITSDITDRIRALGFQVGAGRGSGAGCLIAFLLGITDIPPQKHGLLFERFLDPSRVGMPDFDIDFEKAALPHVVRILQEIYGFDNVAHLGTRGTKLAKAVVRDAGRLTGRPEVGAALAKTVATKTGGKTASLREMLDPEAMPDPSMRDLIEHDPDAQEILSLALPLDGIRAKPGIHACGIIISDTSLVDIIPMRTVKNLPDSAWVTQWDGPEMESLGFLKLDRLGLRNLDIKREAIRLVEADFGLDLHDLRYDHMPWDDPAEMDPVWRMLAEGRNQGIFQIDSAGMNRLNTGAKPRSLDDVSTHLALYRPGPLGQHMDQRYIARRQGLEEVTYDYLTSDPGEQRAIAEILDETMGVICLAQGERVYSATAGRMVPIEEIGVGDVVQGVDDDGRPTLAPVTWAGRTGTDREVLKLELRDGKSVRLTDNHEVYTAQGWKQAKDVTERDVVAVPRTLLSLASEDQVREVHSDYGSKVPSSVVEKILEDNGVRAEQIARILDSQHQWLNESEILALSDSYPELRRLTYSWWVPVKSIHPDGRCDVYDLSVEHVHSFVAEHIVVHNCYQEQVMRLSASIAGFGPGLRNKLRKTISKKKPEDMAAMEDIFIRGAQVETVEGGFIEGLTPPGDTTSASGVFSENTARILWQTFKASADYLFNKCITGDMVVNTGRGVGQNAESWSVIDLYHRLYGNDDVAPGMCPHCGERPRSPRGGKCRRCASWLYKFHHGVGFTVLALDSTDGRIRPARLVDVHANGMREVFKIELSDGRTVRSTSNHRWMTPSGYRQLDELQVGEELVVSYGYERQANILENRVTQGERQGSPGKPWLPRQQNCGYVDGGSIRLAEWTAQTKDDAACDECGRTLAQGRLERAHLDGNRRNNDPSNLAWKCPSHHKLHDYRVNGRRGRWSKGHQAGTATITAITYDGMEEVYDLEMAEGTDHNFLANGVVSHNSHSVAYGLLTVQTAFLKAHWPTHYAAALLSKTEDEKRIIVLNSLRKDGITVHVPDINIGQVYTSVSGHSSITLGLGEVKSVGPTNAAPFVREREANGPFTSLGDALRRVKIVNEETGAVKNVPISAVEALITAGAFDSLHPNSRAGMMMMARALRDGDVPIPEVEWPVWEKAERERRLLGMLVSEHPLMLMGNQALEAARPVIPETVEPVGIGALHVGDRHWVIAQVSAFSIIPMKSRPGFLARFTLEGSGGNVDGVMFDSDLDRQRAMQMVPKPGDFVVASVLAQEPYSRSSSISDDDKDEDYYDDGPDDDDDLSLGQVTEVEEADLEVVANRMTILPIKNTPPLWPHISVPSLRPTLSTPATVAQVTQALAEPRAVEHRPAVVAVTEEAQQTASDETEYATVFALAGRLPVDVRGWLRLRRDNDANVAPDIEHNPLVASMLTHEWSRWDREHPDVPFRHPELGCDSYGRPYQLVFRQDDDDPSI